MIERQDKLPENYFDITESTNSSDVQFVTKVREQKWLTKFKQYHECAEYIQHISIKTEAGFFDWLRHNRETRIKLGIPSNPQLKYENNGRTT
jgi:hypothetical protein